MQFRSRRSQPKSRAVLRWSAAALFAIAPLAHAGANDISGYLTYGSGHPVMGAGQCVRTGEWTPDTRLSGCDPEVKPVAAAEAPPAKAEPAPAPEPAAAPETVAFRISFDTLFDYDSATFKPAGREALEALVSDIASGDGKVQITGHADPLGTRSYNKRLSERRAQVIAAYLVSLGVDASRISANGVGSDEPAVAASECKGLRRAALIECLRFDRYAEVTVSGTVQQVSTSTGDAK